MIHYNLFDRTEAGSAVMLGTRPVLFIYSGDFRLATDADGLMGGYAKRYGGGREFEGLGKTLREQWVRVRESKRGGGERRG
jgi:hypothetical protein